MAMDDAGRFAAHPDRTGSPLLASSAFCSRWPTRLLERVGIDKRSTTGVAEQLHLAVAALGGDRRGQDRPQRLRPRSAARARRRLRRQPREQLVHLADGGLQGRDHVGPELGIVGMPLGIAREQRQLADQVLDVVQDEGEAAVELLEPLRLGERLLAERLGKRARRLVAGGAQQVEILPVELASVFGRGEHHEADQPLVMKQRNRRPRRAVRRAAIGERRALCLRARPSRHAVLRAPRYGRSPQRRSRSGLLRRTRRRAGSLPGQSLAAATDMPRPPSLTSSRPPGASTMSAKARTTRSLKRRRLGPGQAQGFGETKPLGAIVVSMLEQMLGELELHPAACTRTRDQHRGTNRHQRQHGDHQRRGPVDPRSAEGRGEDRHQREISADREQ